MTYSRENCYLLCYQQWCLNKCNCNTQSDKQCLTEEQIECTDKIYLIDYIQNRFYGECDTLCPLECNVDYYELHTMYNDFPSEFYANHLLHSLPIYQKSPYNRSLTTDDVIRSVSRIMIYFEQLTYEFIEEIPTTSVANLFANCGSLLGLFMGMSFLTFSEILEIVYELSLIIFLNN